MLFPTLIPFTGQNNLNSVMNYGVFNPTSTDDNLYPLYDDYLNTGSCKTDRGRLIPVARLSYNLLVASPLADPLGDLFPHSPHRDSLWDGGMMN